MKDFHLAGVRKAVLVAAAVVLSCHPASAQAGKYTPVGLGGGGGMFEPASSPHNPKLMFVSCDMGGFYRSEDGGKHWEMIDFRQTRGRTRCRPVFHPRDPNVVYFAGKVSRDAGKTWTAMVTPTPWRGLWKMGIGPQGRIIVVGLFDGAWISRDEGRSWARCEGVRGKVIGFAFGPPRRLTRQTTAMRVFIGTSHAVYRSDDDGRTWVDSKIGGAWDDARSFTGGARSVRLATGETREDVVLYYTVPSANRDGRFTGGIYRSTDGGETWQSAMGEGLNTHIGKVDRWGSEDIPQYHRIEAAPSNPNVVYVACTGTGYWPPHHNTVYRSDDAGKTWRALQYYDFRLTKGARPHEGVLVENERNFEHGWIPYAITWNWGGLPGRTGLTVNPANPDVVMATNGGELFATTDGGKKWRQCYSAYAKGQPPPIPEPGKRPGRWHSIGLEVTTTWNYHVDPFDHERHFICYTDIGFARSEDGGHTWTHSPTGSPWRNTTYGIVFDPERKERIWAAMSNVHDIPHWTYVHDQAKGPGGVCVSDDGGKTWRKSSDGLPAAPAVSIALDPRSAVGRRTLYVALYDHGVYKSTDDGRTWRAVNNGIDLGKNSHTWLVKLHADGTLFCGVTARRVGGRSSHKFPKVGALYRSRDGGESWEDITRSRPLHWPNEFAVHPNDSNTLYLAASTGPQLPEGGIYKTTDGGKSWQRLLKDEDFLNKGGPAWAVGMFVTMDPKDPDTIYLGTGGHGLWTSHDAGKTWHQLEGLPFGNIHRVTFDPEDHDTVYISTFGGGVWKGPRP